MEFYTGNADGASSTERMRINSLGNMGLGTNSPTDHNSFTRILDINGSGGGAVYCRTNGSSSNVGIFGQSGSDVYVINKASGNIRFNVADAEKMRIDSSGQLLVGKTSGSYPLEVGGVSNPNIRCDGTSSSGQRGLIFSYNGTNFGSVGQNPQSGELTIRSGESGQTGYYITLETGATEAARIDSSQRLLIGTPTARSPGGITASLQVEGTGAADSSITMVRNSNDINPTYLILGKSRGTSNNSNTIVADNDNIGSIQWAAADGTDIGSTAAYITCAVDGGPGANDMPGRLLFGTTPNGSNSPVTRIRITENGFTKITSNNNYVNVDGTYHEINSHISNTQNVIVESSSSSFAANAIDVNVVRSANSAYTFFRGVSGNFADTEFNLRGDGNAYADQTWNGGGADYAEYFEWSDGNTGAEDRRGISVVLVGDKIREAVAGEEPIGVISGNPSVVGDADYDRWKDKYLRDDYGTYIQENYEVEDDDGNTIVQQRRQLNPNYNPNTTYVSREDRTEWDTVGLMGKLRIRKGQVTGARWIKMRDINENVEEWLVR
jgi:hypothetical protein|tara:strand:+ start:1 stop:1653 length:1653 start_codon:yes stop_codon:yes gene_type:complete